jgi:hypothetical protein
LENRGGEEYPPPPCPVRGWVVAYPHTTLGYPYPLGVPPYPPTSEPPACLPACLPRRGYTAPITTARGKGELP